MEILWPYKQTNNTVFFKDGEKEMQAVVNKRKKEVRYSGNRMDENKTLVWEVDFTPNLSEYTFKRVYRKK